MIRRFILRWLFKQNEPVSKNAKDLLFEILQDHPELVFMSRVVITNGHPNGHLIVGKGDKPWENGVIVYYSPIDGISNNDFTVLISSLVKL